MPPEMFFAMPKVVVKSIVVFPTNYPTNKPTNYPNCTIDISSFPCYIAPAMKNFVRFYFFYFSNPLTPPLAERLVCAD
jgi:hypothetical protein